MENETKVVPVEPTDQMRAAGMEAFHTGEEKLMSEWVCRMYKAMIAAAPVSNESGKGREVERLAIGIAKETALKMLLPHAHKGIIDTSKFCDDGGREVQLLLLTGELEHHPADPNLVRVKDQQEKDDE